LAVQKIYLLEHRIVPTPSIYHSAVPLLAHMQNLFFMLLGLDSFGQALQAVLGLGTVMLVYRWTEARYGRFSARLAAGLLVSMPVFWFVLPEGHIEPSSLIAFTLSTFALERYLRQQTQADLFSFALASGYLAGVKTSNLYFTVWLWGIIVVALVRRRIRGEGIAVRPLLGALLLGALIALPWYVKSWVERGNPFWPQNPLGLFGPDRYNPNMAVVQAGVGQAVSWFRQVVPRTLLAPALMTFIPDWFGGDSPKIGPLFLALLPIALWQAIQSRSQGKKRSADRFLLTASCLAGMAFFGAVYYLRLTRYILPMAPLLAVLVAIWFARWLVELTQEYRRRFNVLLAVCFVFVLLYNGAIAWKLHGQKVASALGLVSREVYLATATEPLFDTVPRVPEYGAFRYANEHLTGDDRVLFLGGYRGYYLDIFYIWGRPDMQELIIYPEFTETAEISERFEQLGITAVMRPPDTAEAPDAGKPVYAFESGMRLLTDDFLPEWGEIVYQDEFVELWIKGR